MVAKNKKYIDEDGHILLEAIKKEVMKEVNSHLGEANARMDGISEGQKKVDEELAYIKDKLAQASAMARAAAIASAVPIKPEKGWQPLPIERYPSGWVEKYGVVDVAITPAYDAPSIMINSFVIPVKSGVVFQVPGNVADILEDLGLLGMPGGEK